MPYVITTGKRFDYPDSGVGGIQVASRRAVATLDEAREVAASIFNEHTGADSITTSLGVGTHVAEGVAEIIGESGGVVHGMSDGTVIEVTNVCWNWIVGSAGELGVDTDAVYENGGDLAILAAFNEKQRLD